MGCTQSTESAVTNKKASTATNRCAGAAPLRIVRFSSDVKDCYTIHKQIGEGSISNIYLIQRKLDATQSITFNQSEGERHVQHQEKSLMSPPESKHSYALKEIDTDLVEPKFLDEMRNEINLFQMIDHPNIIKAYEVYDQTSNKGRISIVMEYCSGGDLNTRSPCSNEYEAKMIVAKIVEAVNYLHLLGIIHRDIKHENIMFESTAPDAEIKLIDFGLAQRYGKNERFHDKVGTVYTMSPQVIKGDYDKQADIWSIGVVTYELLVGHFPFWADTRKAIAQKIVAGKYSMEGKTWKHISAEAKDFIKKCLQMEPSLRYTADEALKSAWLSEMTTQKSADLRRSSTISLLHHIAAANLEEDEMDKERESVVESSEFRKLVLLSIAHKTSSRNKILKLRRVFHSLDSNHDGTLSLEELRTGLKRAGFENDASVEKWFQRAYVGDKKSNYFVEISYTEFIAALLETQGELEYDKVAEAFHSFDRDRCGYITRQNLKDALIGDSSMCDEYLEQLLQEADTIGNGRISFDDFQAVINRQTTKCERQLLRHAHLSKISEDDSNCG
ncbi:hypothetical protein ACA910_002702 [Epithemia clementina (nom. ined.)]